jgi:hypothetical protein
MLYTHGSQRDTIQRPSYSANDAAIINQLITASTAAEKRRARAALLFCARRVCCPARRRPGRFPSQLCTPSRLANLQKELSRHPVAHPPSSPPPNPPSTPQGSSRHCPACFRGWSSTALISLPLPIAPCRIASRRHRVGLPWCELAIATIDECWSITCRLPVVAPWTYEDKVVALNAQCQARPRICRSFCSFRQLRLRRLALT